MDVAGTVSMLLAQKPQQVWSIGPGATVFDAIQHMADKNVGSVLVMQDGKLLGILSERDYTRKVILKGKSSKQTPVSEIMTPDPYTVTPATGISECMKLITEKRVRHLPVLRDGQPIGMVSVGDLMKWVMAAQSSTIDQLQSYITGGY
jgi:signal-transduction protein with cAMP-binding, CBS, and nucleotidyltransferase domain